MAIQDETRKVPVIMIPQVRSRGNLSVNAGLSEVGEGFPWVDLGAFGV